MFLDEGSLTFIGDHEFESSFGNAISLNLLRENFTAISIAVQSNSMD